MFVGSTFLSSLLVFVKKKKKKDNKSIKNKNNPPILPNFQNKTPALQ